MNDLQDIEALARALLQSVGATERRRILRNIAGNVRRAQSARIGAQVEPDGSPFAPRRPKPADRPGAFAVKFTYPKGAAEPRLVFMRSWVRQGPLLTGFDVEAGAIRSFFWDKVERWLPVEVADRNKRAGKLRRRGTIRRKAMFRKLRQPSRLRIETSADEASVGFTGPAARVARIHHEGLTDRPAAGARPVRYVRRVLLGLSAGERQQIVDELLINVTKSVDR